MSGARAPGTNVVPMPTAAPAPMPMAYPWPMPPGGFPAGCCPPGGMDALMQCYCDIQAAKNFIGKIVLDLMQTDPAFASAMVQAIADSGAALPLVGVTNGQPAQPGQVGEFIQFQLTQAYPAGTNTYPISAGVLQPGDWDVWAWVIAQQVTGINFMLSPAPAGFSSNMSGELYDTTSTDMSIISIPTQGLISVPSLLAFSLQISATAAGTANLLVSARRRR